MAQHKIWPYRILGLDRNASLASAHAAHKRLCARLGTSPMEVARRGRYDAALAWCVEHWLDAVILPPHGPFKERSFKPTPDGGRAKAEGHTQGRRAERTAPGGDGPTFRPPTDDSTAVKALLPPPPLPPPLLPPSTPRSAAEVLALRRARAAYRAAIAALSEPPPVRTWRA